MSNFLSGLSAKLLLLLLIILFIVLISLVIFDLIANRKVRLAYQKFMVGKNRRSLEDNLAYRLEQVDELVEANASNERNLDAMSHFFGNTFQKYGLIKYDALDEMGGKLSFALAMLNKSDNGFVMNVVHSREGCFTYMKEIIGGNAIVPLAREEEEAVKKALEEEL